MIIHSCKWCVMTNDSRKNVAMGQRLRDERVRLNLIQLQACQIAGVLEQAWVRYEKGDPFKIEMIEPLRVAGFDMIYVIFGVRTIEKPLTVSEQVLLRQFNAIEPAHHSTLMLLIDTFAKAHPKS